MSRCSNIFTLIQCININKQVGCAGPRELLTILFLECMATKVAEVATDGKVGELHWMGGWVEDNKDCSCSEVTNVTFGQS